jgi:hypothetical protein
MVRYLKVLACSSLPGGSAKHVFALDNPAIRLF